MATIRWPETEDELPPELADLVDGLAEMIARNILAGEDERTPEARMRAYQQRKRARVQ